MVDLPKYLRSKSQKLLGAIETVLNLPVTLERQLNGENNLNGSAARSLVRRRSSRREEENEYESKFTGIGAPSLSLNLKSTYLILFIKKMI